MRAILPLLLVCAGVVSCTASDRPAADPRPGATAAPPAQDPPAAPEPRGLTRPDRVVVDNQATGRFKDLLATAIADLKAVTMWRELTKELFVVELSARPGRGFVPKDAHLADAYRTLDIRGEQGGVLCDITFYPTAMSDDLARWEGYYAEGRISDRPPSTRQLWASVLAHELSHCLKKNNDEEHAQVWERRALGALRQAGLD